MIFFKPTMTAIAGAAMIGGSTTSDNFTHTTENRKHPESQYSENHVKSAKDTTENKARIDPSADRNA